MSLTAGAPGLPADRFQVERELGRGGMSTVYLAFDRKHDRHVAVKLLRTDLAAALGAERFALEIRVTAQLQHPHILPLLESDRAGEHTYYVMPFVEGESLRDRMAREGPLPVADALQVARDVADALAYAHERGVVHRDIKPENILLSAGHAVVADFGIARATAAAAALDLRVTEPGLTVGTPIYMSPEQALGEAVDGRSDLYSLGCVLYEMLTGRPPFDGATAVALIARKITEAAPDAAATRADLPAAVNNLLSRLLARETAHRLERAHDLKDAIDALLRGVPLPAAITDPPPDAVAVLAFTTFSPDRSDDYLGEGLSEALMHALGRVPGLRVIARTSAFSFKQSGLDVREIGRQLRVRRVVEGSVRRAGDRLRVTAKLIDAATAVELWSEQYDRRLDDFFALEDELAGAIATRLTSALRGEREPAAPGRTRPAVAAPASHVPAYEAYLKGRYWWAQRTGDALHRAHTHLEEATRLDSGFAQAHGALAIVLATQGLYGTVAPREVMPRARSAAERALALDPACAEALTARGCVYASYEWDWAAATADYQAAIQADPHDPTARQWYASTVLVPQGRFPEAHEVLARARDLDPLSLAVSVGRAAAYYYERRAAEALAQCREVLHLDSRFLMGQYFLGLALDLAGSLPEAEAALRQAHALAPSAEAEAALGGILAARGAGEEARLILESLAERARTGYLSPVLLAQVATRLGQTEAALEHLEHAREVRAADLIWIGVRPVFDRLRAEPRFAGLLHALRLEASGAAP
jgi:serine/threonine-protein kinase